LALPPDVFDLTADVDDLHVFPRHMAVLITELCSPGCSPGVESLPRLAAEVSGSNLLPQNRGRLKPRTDFAGEVFGDR
jgi:hypothetical protein